MPALATQLLLSWWAPAAGLVLLAASYLWAYVVTQAALRSVPGPWFTRLTNLGLAAACRRGRRYAFVDQLHRHHGPVVRIQPNHVSIADESAIPIIYGHGNGFLKTDFYDAFVSIRRGLFTSRDRAEHARKRKIVSHTFSPRSVGQFEPHIRACLAVFIRQLDRLIDESEHRCDDDDTASPPEARFDCLPWFNYLAFDIIGSLAFGTPFGMLAAGADMAEVVLLTADDGDDGDGSSSSSKKKTEQTARYAPAIEILNNRGEVSATLGCLPPPLRPLTRWLPDPFFRRGMAAVKILAGIAFARVQQRLREQHTEDSETGKEPPNERRRDLLTRLQEGRDDAGNPLGREELTAEALTQLIAGSDTTSNSSCALVNFVGRSPEILTKLQAELDAAVSTAPWKPDSNSDADAAGLGGDDDDDEKEGDVVIPRHEDVRDLPYLGSVVNETLRHHSTSAMGLPREVTAADGIEVGGRHFPAGTVLSVPAYTVHHLREVWGGDADEFCPERWAEGRLTARQRAAFIPFSKGPRACVGRNLAEMEMRLIAATWAVRYRVRVLEAGAMETVEGFLRKPTGLMVGLSRR